MKVASLFAGVGGFDLALTRLGHEIVYVNEWDKYATQTYEKNFEHKVDTRSITDVPTSDIPDHDLLVGGFPCQSFSIAGKRGGFEDTRGTMFFEIARILKDKRPAYLLLENVKGLLSHDNGATFETIMRTLTELGYELEWQVLNSKNFGVPQNRERVFIIGHLGGTGRSQVFPIRAGSTTDDAERVLAHTLNASDWRGANRNQQQTTILQLNNPVHSNDRIYGASGISPTINTAQGGNRQPKIATRYPLKFLERNQRNIEGDYAYTIDSANTGGLNVNGAIRRLTPTECERLQGFPDGWTEGVSDTQRYKQLGNAVTVNVVQAITQRMFA